MPTQEGFLTIILVAIVLNLVLAVGLLAGPWIRHRRRHDEDEVLDAEMSRRVLLRAHLFGGVGESDEPSSAGLTQSNATAGSGRINTSVAELLVPTNERPFDDQPRVFSTAAPRAGDVTQVGTVTDPGERLDAGMRGDGEADDHSDIVQTDSATGFDGPATWAKRLTEENARVARYGRAATVVLVELAGVDRLADRLGPTAAVRILPPIATTMRRNARSADSLARLSPTRFAVLLPDTDEVRAINYVERVRSACDVWLEAGAVSLRLSMGWAEINANQPVDPAIQVAEQRLNMERHRLRGGDAREVDDRRDAFAGPMQPAGAN
jgi:diguanylate cyclase (GGDEF)-like protein